MEDKTLITLVDANAAQFPQRTAVVCGDERLTHEMLAERTRRLAAGFASAGIARGDVVLQLLPNNTDFAVSYLALASLGAGVVLIDPQSKEHELEFAFRDCRPRAVITDENAAERCRSVATGLKQGSLVFSTGEAPEGVIALRDVLGRSLSVHGAHAASDDPVLYQYSSGSTGRPKRVERTQSQCWSEARLLVETFQMTPDDAILCCIPLFHAYGFGSCLLAAAASGAKLVIQPYPAPFAVKRQHTLELITREKVTMLPIVPFMAELLATARHDADLASIRYCYSAGTALQHAVFTAFDSRFGIPVRQLYGCTEVPSIAVNLDADPRQNWASVGQAMVGVEIRIQNEDGSPLPPGAVGEVGVRSPGGANGYVGDKVRDYKTFRDGWVFPGDLGSLDAEGRLSLGGRTRIFIEVAGQKVDPLEVEDVLALHPGVREAVVVGTRQDTARDEMVKAAVVARGPCTEQELIKYCRERLAAYKVPQIVEFRDSIPRSAIGKVLRKELL